MGWFGDAKDWVGDKWSDFKNFNSGGPGYEYQAQPDRQDQIDNARRRDGEDRAFQIALMKQYQDRVNGKGTSVAEAQLAETTAQNQQQQIAMANSGSGGPLGNSAQQYGAARNAASINQDANRQGATLRAQEQAAYMKALADQQAQMRDQDQSAYANELDQQRAWIEAQNITTAGYEAAARRNAGGGMLGGFAQAYGAFRGGGSDGGGKNES